MPTAVSLKPAAAALARTRALRVVVVDDHPVVCDGVALLLSRQDGADVVGAAFSGSGAVDVTRACTPDVVLLDMRLPDTDTDSLIRQLKAAAPAVKVLLFTAHPEPAIVERALAAGAHGCLLKDVTSDELVEALHDVARGGRVLDPRLSSRPDLALGPRLDSLSMTRREFDVVRLVATGMSNPEIAVDLGLTRNTVKTYLQTAMQKLGARNRVDAVAKAQAARLL